MKKTFGWLCLLVLAFGGGFDPISGPVQAQTPLPPPDLAAVLAEAGTARVVVALQPPLVGLRTAAQADQIAQTQDDILQELSAEDFTVIHRYETLPGLVGEVTAEGLEILLANPDVAAVALDLPVTAQTDEPALLHDYATTGLGLTFSGAGVNVAILDSGVDTAHVDLAGRVIGQHCFDRDGACPPGRTVESESAQDENGHGSHVAGIIASRGQTSPPGLAPGVGLVAVRVLSRSGTGYTSDVIAGIDWVVANQAGLNVKVMNLSLGGGSYEGVCDETDANTRLYATAVAAARQAGITIFAAAGNRGLTNQLMAPACVSGVLAVGNVYNANIGSFTWPTCVDTTTASDQITCSSNSSSALDLLAPGVQVTSTRLGGGQNIQSGTSMSTAYATGVAALLLEVRPELTPTEIETVLKETGRPVTDGRNGLVIPRIDPAAALQRVTGDETVTITGTILLQGRTDHRGTLLRLSESACAAASFGALAAVTAANGAFEIVLPAAHRYQCLQAQQPGYLAGQADLTRTGLGVATLPAGDVTADQRIDIFDLALVGNRYGQRDSLADLNANGIVDIIDLTLVALNYRRMGPITLGVAPAE